ncbi:LAMI_0G03290g1_1 [Lachancea mirantina]|uniref:LAMI_0G03290g1_1 n=1 Tax=Lachancea mirantina TaxID=1230905 RepID=A0A1G4K828_9SACH|nr:LAMI_0G03290g1_1 [Lachancea mirantina]
MAKRLLPEDVQQENELLKRQRAQQAEAAEQSNIDAQLLQEKPDAEGASGDEAEGLAADDDDEEKYHSKYHEQDHDGTAAAAAAAAAVYGGLMSADEAARHQQHGQGHDAALATDHASHEGDESQLELDADSDDRKRGIGRRGRKAAPVTGSAEWRQQRKDSHKEVERRRRENINTAIVRLSDLLPVKESSKATVLARAAEYIQKLRDTENANIEKWTLQKLLSEQQVSTLTKANETMQLELGNAFKQIDILKRQLKNAGVPLDPEISGLEAGNTEDK